MGIIPAIIAGVAGLAGTAVTAGMSKKGSDQKADAMKEAAAKMGAYREEMPGLRAGALQNMLPLFGGLGAEMNRQHGPGAFNPHALQQAARNPFAAAAKAGPIPAPSAPRAHHVGTGSGGGTFGRNLGPPRSPAGRGR